MPPFAPLPYSLVRGLSRCNASSLRFQLTQKSPGGHVFTFLRSQSTVPRKPTPKSTPKPPAGAPTLTSKISRKLAQLDRSLETSRLAHFLRDKRPSDPNNPKHPRNRQAATAIGTLIAGTIIYSFFAFLDVQFGTPFRSDDDIRDRASATLPQTWYLTPDVVRQGALALWKDLDGVTIWFSLPLAFGVVASAAKRKSFQLPDLAIVLWFLPSMVHSLDRDGFHAFALASSVPMVAFFMTELVAYRLKLADALVRRCGSGIALIAMGFYGAEHAHEKVWAPPGVALRVDAWMWTAGYVAMEMWMTARGRGVTRMVHLARVMHIGCGAAYAYFNLKHHLWIPLVSTISGARGDEEVIEEEIEE